VSQLRDYAPTFPKWRKKDPREVFPQLDDNGISLLEAMLRYDPASRISAKEALRHPFFDDVGSEFV
jgi:serine/threonine protein kinase